MARRSRRSRRPRVRRPRARRPRSWTPLTPSLPPSLAFARSNAQTQGGQQVEQANLSRAELVRRKQDLHRRTIAAHNPHLDTHDIVGFARALLLLFKPSMKQEKHKRANCGKKIFLV